MKIQSRAKVRSKRVMDRKVREIFKRMADGAPCEIAAAMIGGEARVMFGAGGLYLTMPPHQARRFAAAYRSPEALAAGLGNLGDDFATAADVADAQCATRQ